MPECIHRRKSLKAKFCNYFCNKKNRRLQDHASELLGDQLDIVEVLRHQMVSKISIRALFSKVERYLLTNQANPFVITEKKKPCLSDDFEDMSSFEFPPITSKTSIYNKLAAGVFVSKA